MPEFEKTIVNVPKPDNSGFTKGYLLEDGQTAFTVHGRVKAVNDDGELDPQTILYDSQGNPILGSEAKLPR